MNVIILAAGQGKRFGGTTPKVLVPLRGMPMISRLLDAVAASCVTECPVVVVGYGAQRVRDALGGGYDYVTQDRQLGTGNAVACCRDRLQHRPGPVLVLYGDMPMLTAATIRRIADTHSAHGPVLTMATVTATDFADWRACLASYGRVVRDANGQLERIAEVRDATPAERQIREVNPSYFCFRGQWLWPNLGCLQTTNVLGEFYLTDLLGLAVAEGMPVHTVPVEPREALGANTPEELAILESLLSADPIFPASCTPV